MSFLNLRRLLPPRKVWKIITNKLQIKLHKLNRSKAIEKHKIQFHKTSKKLSWPSLSIQPKKFKLKPKPHTLIHLNKITPPVYVDRHFIGSISTVKGRVHPPLAALRKEANNKKPCPAGNLKRRGGSYQKNYRPKNENRGAAVTSYQESNEADDMWESMVLTSPQTQGIDERAEEFIARFRAQLRHQEMLARRL